MLTLLALVALATLSSADIRDSMPPNGSCLCVDDHDVSVRLNGCGTTVGRASTGQCFKHRGEYMKCDLYGTTPIVSFKVTFGYNVGWISGYYLEFGKECLCQERADDVIRNATLRGCPDTTSRAEWVARNARLVININHPVPKVIVYHTGTAPCSIWDDCKDRMRDLQDQSLNFDRKGDTVYNFAVGEDGNVYEGVGWDRVGERPDNWTSVSIGVGIIGNFSTPPPNESTLKIVQQLIACGVSNGKISENYTIHEYCDIICGECSDAGLYNVIKTWPHYGGKLPGSC